MVRSIIFSNKKSSISTLSWIVQTRFTLNSFMFIIYFGFAIVMIDNVHYLSFCTYTKYSLHLNPFLGSKSINAQDRNIHFLSAHEAKSFCHCGMIWRGLLGSL